MSSNLMLLKKPFSYDFHQLGRRLFCWIYICTTICTDEFPTKYREIFKIRKYFQEFIKNGSIIIGCQNIY